MIAGLKSATKTVADNSIKTFGAVILAAGASSRIGSPKALLSWRGMTFLENILGALRGAGIRCIRVVTSPAGEASIRQSTASSDVDLKVNPDPSRGQFSSLQCGLRDLDADFVFVCLVDHPKITSGVMLALKAACEASDAPAVIPRFQGKRGHPLALGRALVAEILREPATGNTKEVLNRHRPSVLELETLDSGIIADIDTPADYEHFLGRKFQI